MARQISPIGKLKGKIDQMAYFETADGYMAAKTPRFNKDAYLKADSYDLARRNASEFGIGGRAGKVFRSAWNTEINKAGDRRLVSRLTRVMVKTLQTDTVSEYGYRKVENGALTMLEEFEFNLAMPFSMVVTGDLPVTIARATGQVTINLPAFIPRNVIAAPSGATHYSFFAAAAAIDFAAEEATTDRVNTADIPWSMAPTVAGTMALTLPANSTLPLFVVLGVEFKKIINGTAFEMTEKQCSLRVIAVDMP